MTKQQRCIWRSAAAFLVLYLVFCGIVYFRPQWFFYNPSPDSPRLEQAVLNGYQAEEVKYPAGNGQELPAWYTKPAAGNGKIILFFHGNSHNIESFYHKLQPLAQAGYGIFLPEFRGFGGQPGKITETSLTADALEAVSYLHRLGYSNDRIVLYGMSLGSNLAVNTAAVLGQKQPFAGLILEVPFDSLYEVVSGHVWFPLPLNWLIHDRYDNLAKIAEVNTSLLVMAAQNDTLVPVEHARRLYAKAADPREMIIYHDAGHNDLYAHANYKDILDWLKK